MFTQSDTNGKTKLTNLTKFVGSVLAIIGFIAGGVLYFETTYFHKAEAKEMRIELEAETVSTFKQQQQILELQRKDLERIMDIRFLEQLQCQKVLVEKALQQHPIDTLLIEKYRRIKDIIKKLEDKLFQ